MVYRSCQVNMTPREKVVSESFLEFQFSDFLRDQKCIGGVNKYQAFCSIYGGPP